MLLHNCIQYFHVQPPSLVSEEWFYRAFASMGGASLTPERDIFVAIKITRELSPLITLCPARLHCVEASELRSVGARIVLKLVHVQLDEM